MLKDKLKQRSTTGELNYLHSNYDDKQKIQIWGEEQKKKKKKTQIKCNNYSFFFFFFFLNLIFSREQTDFLKRT